MEENKMRKKELRRELNHLRDRIWKLEHPPKFKKGDTVVGQCDDSTAFRRFVVREFYYHYECWLYTVQEEGSDEYWGDFYERELMALEEAATICETLIGKDHE